jgi:hypothetical protein
MSSVHFRSPISSVHFRSLIPSVHFRSLIPSVHFRSLISSCHFRSCSHAFLPVAWLCVAMPVAAACDITTNFKSRSLKLAADKLDRDNTQRRTGRFLRQIIFLFNIETVVCQLPVVNLKKKLSFVHCCLLHSRPTISHPFPVATLLIICCSLPVVNIELSFTHFRQSLFFNMCPLPVVNRSFFCWRLFALVQPGFVHSRWSLF